MKYLENTPHLDPLPSSDEGRGNPAVSFKRTSVCVGERSARFPLPFGRGEDQGEGLVRQTLASLTKWKWGRGEGEQDVCRHNGFTNLRFKGARRAKSSGWSLLGERVRVKATVSTLSLLLLAGCERKAPEGGVSAPKSASAPSVNAKASPEPTQPPKDSKAEMVLISGGRFMMGEKDEVDAPLHEVVVSSFYMDKNLVTQEQFEKAMGANPSRWKGVKNPVEQVRWSDAVRFCNKRSELEGLQSCYDTNTWKCNFDANGYRLPTEAEWEYACRAGSTTAYFFGDNPAKLGEYAWFEKNSGGHPRPVGQKQPNPRGLRS